MPSNIDSAAEKHIEDRIADAMLARQRFDEHLTASEFADILQNLVGAMFAKRKVGGIDVAIGKLAKPVCVR